VRRRTWIITLVVVLLIAGGAGYYFWYQPKNGGVNQQSQNAQTVTVTKDDVINSITVYGEVIPKQEYTYTFDGNEIKEILVSEGERVEEGDPLVKLDSEQKRLKVLQAEQALEEARAEGVKAVIGQKELEYQIAKEEYQETTLNARFTGVVTGVNQATASSEAWSIVLIDTSQLYIQAEVNQLDVPSLSEVKQAEATIEPLSGRSWQVEMVKIGGMAVSSGNSKVVEIKAELPQVEEPILPGYTATLDITTSNARDVLRIPISSLLETGRGWIAMKVTREGTIRQPVEVGVTSDQYAEIKSGLNQGDEILLYPTSLEEGSDQPEDQDRPNQREGGDGSPGKGMP